MVWSCLPFIRSGQNHLARHSEKGKKTRQTEEEVGRQHQGMDRPGVRQVTEGAVENGEKWRKLEDEKLRRASNDSITIIKPSGNKRGNGSIDGFSKKILSD